MAESLLILGGGMKVELQTQRQKNIIFFIMKYLKTMNLQKIMLNLKQYI